ncbi:c-type cytochrome biogenesis protein CcsB [Thermanaeromonas sp. C210]|uniref:c-type cytochrome biogenesis protein CcsB n=1 Tax=Thermanaeromonas sp. C210 TaxID=2731925 RepID=UPI00155BFD13|nr:c-type cytochrome biogenesis protein CcsB [Thermanaeromonas sp. C210]GFN23218.1 c-type cytochrome biogenesis protein CcsB [Thermanaeromonas sp. C210]
MEARYVLAAYLLLLAALFLSLILLWQPHRQLGRASLASIAVAFFLLFLALGQRTLNSGHLPVATLYEFSLLLVWGLLLLFFFIRKHVPGDLLTVLVALLGVLILSFSNTLPSESRPLMPALQSVWLQLHVLTAIIAYGAFGLSFCLGIIYLLQERARDREVSLSLPSPAKLDNLMYWCTAVGFAFMTLVLITGAVWAEEVWGRWWGWDPKETWALITWLIYAGFLHARKTYGWQGKRAAVIAVAGFVAVLFTLFGVSLLLPGLHSYI